MMIKGNGTCFSLKAQKGRPAAALSLNERRLQDHGSEELRIGTDNFVVSGVLSELCLATWMLMIMVSVRKLTAGLRDNG
jgi:hypothetical protein